MDFEVAENNFQKSCVTRCFSKGYKKLTVKKVWNLRTVVNFCLRFRLPYGKLLKHLPESRCVCSSFYIFDADFRGFNEIKSTSLAFFSFHVLFCL